MLVVYVAFWIAVVVGFAFAIILFGEASRAFILIFALLWIAVPIVACLLNNGTVFKVFTLVGLKRLQVILVVASIVLSFGMFANWDFIRNHVGRGFVEGYRYWRAEPDVDDYGRPFYPGDEWTAKNWTGRTGLSLFVFTLFVAEIALPIVTGMATSKAIDRAERSDFINLPPPNHLR